MNLQTNIKRAQSERGFTIVELLIVIVVIGILAAITLVAFNGVTNRAKTQSANASASGLQKKIEAYNAAEGSYPLSAATGAALKTTLNSVSDSSIGDITIGVPDSTTGQKMVQVEYCTAGGTGVRLGWFDFSSNAVVDTSKRLVITASGSCTTWGTPLAAS